MAAAIEWLALGSPAVTGVPGLAAACSTGLVTDVNSENRLAAATGDSSGGTGEYGRAVGSGGGQAAAVGAAGHLPGTGGGARTPAAGAQGGTPPTLDFGELDDDLESC